jgi:hypothetical protein
MHIKMLIALLLILGICSCANHTLSLEAMLKESKPTEVDFSQCPKIDGWYHSLGTSDSNVSDYMQNPILERNSAGMPDIASRDNTVHIEPKNNSFDIRYSVYDKNKKLLRSKIFSTSYECKNHIMIDKSFVEGGSGESSHISTYSVFKTFLSKDQSTLIIKTSLETISRTWFFGREKSITEFEYRYKKIEGTY